MRYIARIKHLLPLVTLLASFTAPVFLPQHALAQLDDVCDVEPNSEFCQEQERLPGNPRNSFYGEGGLLTRIAQGIAMVGGVAAVFLIVLAGFKFVTSSGDPNNISSARNTIIYALIGVAVAASAQALVVFVLNRL